MELKKGFMESRVAMGMLAVQGFAVGLQILSRIILNQGTFIFALMTYRQIVGAICVAPLAFYYDRFVNFLIPFLHSTNFFFYYISSKHLISSGPYFRVNIIYESLHDDVYFGYCRSHFKKLTRVACFWLFMVALTGYIRFYF